MDCPFCDSQMKEDLVSRNGLFGVGSFTCPNGCCAAATIWFTKADLELITSDEDKTEFIGQLEPEEFNGFICEEGAYWAWLEAQQRSFLQLINPGKGEPKCP